VLAFDPSMGQQTHERSKGVMFYNEGLSYEKNDKYRGNHYGRPDILQYWNVDSIAGYMSRFNHTHGALLKVDIEGNEWDSLLKAIRDRSMLNFDQLLFEIHFYPNSITHQQVNGLIDKWYSLFQELEIQGWEVFYSHTNPQSSLTRFPSSFYVPCCYELSLINTNNLPNYRRRGK